MGLVSDQVGSAAPGGEEVHHFRIHSVTALCAHPAAKHTVGCTNSSMVVCFCVFLACT